MAVYVCSKTTLSTRWPNKRETSAERNDFTFRSGSAVAPSSLKMYINARRHCRRRLHRDDGTSRRTRPAPGGEWRTYLPWTT